MVRGYGVRSSGGNLKYRLAPTVPASVRRQYSLTVSLSTQFRRVTRVSHASVTALPGVLLQELQCLVVELRDVLIDWRVRTPFKNQQFGIANPSFHSICKACRS